MAIERVVVAVDFESPSIEALRWTASYLSRNAALTLVHVVENEPIPAFLRAAFPSAPAVATNARLGAAPRLRDLAASLSICPARVEVLEGRPAPAIGRLAEEIEADLIVVGPPGKRRGALNVLGSTAEHPLRTSSVPVFVAHPLPVGPARRVLAAVDASPHAPAVVQMAAALAQANGGDLGIVHAIDPVLRFHMRRGLRASAASCVDEMLRERARDWLIDLCRDTVDGPSSRTSPRRGAP